MPKRLNQETLEVKLGFSADVSQAKRQIAELQSSLQKLATQPAGQNWTKDIEQAQNAAAELVVHLKNATNVDTGKIDFSRLNQSIKQGGKTVAQYGDELLKLGPAGQQSFQQLARAIANSEIPVRRINKSLQEMGNVLKNTIRWQISSSALHSFMGAVQSAYGYAQDLNQSLNNIRIVTGQNIEQMDKFAARANKAAQALSTSTLEYTKASLIYYQQGLSDEEVQARTDVTVKMANVTGDSAEKVSQQLTAVWNNYAKGADNLEYFADVMTALGAATASSSDEIAQGLEKFAAIGETVGLSYDYAAAALATVTATTRQSADVVGNAFKTLFARLEGLKLGDTLEDGTDLNKYSKALMAVGVNIKETNGDMKAMDDILDELAAKWNMLGKDQQMALAQTVAGVRQYTQLIALMNNWDFMQQNVKVARESSGTLQKQADTYAEGWEAAQKRVQAALKSIYQKLINDDFFITLLNDAEKVIGFIDNMIDGLGGLPGLLSLVGTAFLQAFGPQLQESLRNTVYSLQMMTAKGREKATQARSNTIMEMAEAIRQNSGYNDATVTSSTRGDMFEQEAATMEVLARNSDKLNDSQKSLYKLNLQNLEANKEELLVEAQTVDKIKEEINEVKSELDYIQQINLEKSKMQAKSGIKNSLIELDATGASVPTQWTSFIQNIEGQLSALNIDANEFWVGLGGKDHIAITEENVDRIANHFEQFREIELKKTQQEYDQLTQSQEAATSKMQTRTEQLTNAHKKLREEIVKGANSSLDWAGKITKGAQALTALVNVSNVASGLFDTFTDKSKSVGDQISSTIGSLSSIAISSIMGIKAAIDVLGTAGGIAFGGLSLVITGITLFLKWRQYAKQAALEEVQEVEKQSATKIAKLKEEKNATEDLAKTYADLYAMQDETAEGKNSLREAALKAVEAYNIENGYLLIAQENYKQLAIEIAEARRQKALYVAETARENLNDQASVVAQNIENETGAKRVVYGKDGQDIKGLSFYAGQGVEKDWIKRAQELGIDARAVGDDLYLFIEESAQGLTNSIESLTKFYQYLDSVYNTTGDKDAKNMAAKINSFVNTSQGFIEPLAESISATAVLQIEEAVQNKLHDKNYSINSLTEYIQLEDEVSNELSSQGYNFTAADIRNQFSNNGFQNFASQSAWLRDFSRKSGIGLNLLTGLSEEQFATMLQIDPSVVNDFDQLLQLINKLNSVGQYSIAQANAAKYTTAAANIKEGQTQAEIDKVLSDAGITLTDVERQDFYRKTSEERKAELEKRARDEIEIEKSKGKEIEKINIDELKTKKDTLIAEQQAAVAEAKNKEMAYAYYQKQIDALNEVINLEEQKKQVQIDSIFRAQELAETYNSILTSDVDIGDTVSQEFADQLAKIGVNISQYLVPNGDGTYVLRITGAEFRDETFNAILNNWENYSNEEQAQNKKVILDNITNFKELEKVASKGILKQREFVNSFNKLQNKFSVKDLDTEELRKYQQYLLSIANTSEDLGDKLYNGLTAHGSLIVSAASLKATEGLEALIKNLDTWKESVNSINGSNTQEYQEAILGMRDAVASLLSLDPETIDPTWIITYKDLIFKAASGQKEDLEKLKDQFYKSSKENLLENFNFSQEEQEVINNFFDTFQNYIDTHQIKIGENFDASALFKNLGLTDAEYKKFLNAIMSGSQQAVAEVNKIFAALGFKMELTGTRNAPSRADIAKQLGRPLTGEGALSGREYAQYLADHSGDFAFDFRVTKLDDSVNYRPPTTGSGGGGSSKAKANKEFSSKKEDERYVYIREQLEDLQRAYTATGKAKDRAFGDERLRYLDEEIALTDQLIGKQSEYIAEIQGYLEDDNKLLDDESLNSLLGPYDLSLDVDIDDLGRISNWDSIEDQINAMRKKAVDTYNKNKNNDNAEDIFERTNDAIDEAERRVKQQKETLNLLEQTLEERVDSWRQEQDLQFERANYILEVNMKLTDNELKALNFQADLLKDNLYKSVEAMELLVGSDFTGFNAGMMKEYNDELSYTVDHFEELKDLWSQDLGVDTKGNTLHGISQADFIEGLQNDIDTIYDKLKEILNVDKEMFEYYANTLTKSRDEIARYRDEMDSITSAMEHWKSILDLTSKSNKEYYKQLDAILKGQRDAAGNDYAVSKQRYEDLLKQQKAAEEALAGATGERERELLQHNLDAINEQVREALEKMLSDAETYAQRAKDVLINAMEAAAAAAEDTLTQGMGFDALNDSMDRIRTNQDEYLTKTNQLYEMNKMLGQLQRDSDKANSDAAKARIANFAKEMEGLRDKNQLSNLDLEIAQARYELLLAQIALEEAQNAKSVVRLQRDNEGNFGYVYTADGDKIAQAQDDFEKKQNDLYNIVLRGTNNYGEKMIQLNQEYLEKLKEINEKYTEENGYTEEQRQAELLRAQEEYNTLRQTYEEQYTTAMYWLNQTAATGTQEAWVNSFDTIIDNGQAWHDATTGYIREVDSALTTFKEDVSLITDEVGKDYEETRKKVKDLTNEHDDLANKLQEEVLPAVSKVEEAVQDATDTYAKHRDRVYEMVTAYQKLLEEMSKVQLDAANETSGLMPVFDTSQDYSRLMAEAFKKGDTELISLYGAYRDRKTAAQGLSDADLATKNWKTTKDIIAVLTSDAMTYEEKIKWLKDNLYLPEGFNTGGYTGEWGSGGKLAFLHQKELVLNADDTRNLLDSITIVRDIAKSIDLRAQSAVAGYGISAPAFGFSQGAMEQTVTIHAEFPNVTDHNEIEEAFNNLRNRATQYANRY